MSTTIIRQRFTVPFAYSVHFTHRVFSNENQILVKSLAPRKGKTPVRVLLVVDDGIATGLSARAALLSLQALQPSSISLAVPVIDRQLVPEFLALVQRLVAVAVVAHLEAVGLWYDRFEQLDDATVIALLARHGAALHA